MKSVATDDSSPTRDHVPRDLVQPSPVAQPIRPLPGELVGDIERDPTVISQRPVAATADFTRSLSLMELARTLEGRQLDHFAVERMIGGGGMGAVFRGRDLRLNRDVAIKVIPESRRDPETLRRFRMEAQSAARLDHPNIARVYDIGEDEAWNYIVFEFIDGINLRDLVQLEGPMGIDDAVFTTRQVAEALQHAHDRDVVHRDIKPSNVIITPTGVAKVVDMGLARNTALDRSAADQTASGVTLGTFDYISPEQARDPRDADVRSDLYSLGCTLFYMLTGQPPFPEGTALQKLLNHGSQPPPDPRQWRDDISDQLYAVLAKLMAKRPPDRYQKPLELINDLLLIAQLERLPRSRTAGTIVLRPTVAQRSLLETHLPWLVPMTVLLISAFWLQSANSLTAQLDLPMPSFRSPQAANVSGVNAPSRADEAVEQPSRLQPPESVSAPEPLRDPANTPPFGAATLPSAPLDRDLGQRPGPLNGPMLPATPRSPLEGLLSSASGSALNELRQRTMDISSGRATETPAAPNEFGPVLGGSVNTAAPTTSAAGPGIGNSNVANSRVSSSPSAVAAPLAAANSAGPANTADGKSPDYELPSAPVRDTIIVCTTEPDQRAGNAVWCASLAEALVQANILSDIRVIELQESIELDRVITLPRTGLTLRAPPGTSLEIVLTGEHAYGMGWETWFEIGRYSLHCEGLRFTCRNDMRQTQAVFALRAGGQLTLHDCVITMAENHDAPLGIGILINEPERSALPFTASSSTTAVAGSSSGLGNSAGIASAGGASSAASSDQGPATVSLRNCIARGHQTLIAMRTACRAEITLEDTCAMLAGRVLTIRAVEPERMPPVVRLSAVQSTLVSEQGFAAVQTGFAQRVPLTLIRTAKLCAFWSPSTVPHIAVDGLFDEAALDELLQLRGIENAYDQNIEILCQCRFADGRHLDFSFPDATGEWFQERFNVHSLPWQNSVPPERPLEEQLPEDYRLRSGMFMPGYLPAPNATTPSRGPA